MPGAPRLPACSWAELNSLRIPATAASQFAYTDSVTPQGIDMTHPATFTSRAVQTEPQSAATAPVWHTAVVLLLLAAMAALSMRMGFVNPAAQGRHRALGYLITMASEWIIVGFITLGISLRTLVGRFAFTWRAILLDLAIAVAYLLVAQVVLGISTALVGHFLHSNVNDVLKTLLPHTTLETALYLLLALTAGICEETIFRGYLQHQFTSWTGSAFAAIVIQGLIFGTAHAYQGLAMVIVISIYGWMFGSLAYWRRSLCPGMTAHFLQDAIGGIVLSRMLTR